MTQYKVLQWAFSFLEKSNRDPKVAELLLQYHLNMSREAFFLHMRTPLKKEVYERFKQDIIRHATSGVPLEHLTGEAYFYGRKFFVNSDVLIPRFETEELVEHVIRDVKKRKRQSPVTIVDLGTGSGVIAITLALELEHVHVYATDISEEALKVARKNATMHRANVTFYQGDFLQPLIDREIDIDYIVSNPPYIARNEELSLQDTVRNYDPALALFAENDGLAAYETIVQQIASLAPRKNRTLYVEIGYTQSDAVHDLIRRYTSVEQLKTIQDINEKDRIVCATIE